MDILDLPANPHFKNGKVFPPNVVLMGYIFLGVSLIALLGNVFIGIALFLIGFFIVFTSNHVVVNMETETMKEYTAYFGFLKIGKTISYKKYSIITVIPVKLTITAYTRSTQSTTSTDYLFGVFLLTGNFRGKKELTKFSQKSQSEELAKELSHRMGMEYFEYDPKVIREKMLGR